MGVGLVCAQCGQRIIGVGKKAYGKVYCESCYEALMNNIQKNESAKKELTDYICKLFVSRDCPEDVIYAIDTSIRDGKKISGIKGTIYYYFEIMGHQADLSTIHTINFVIKTEYENARKYFMKQQEIKRKNAEVDLNLPPVIIKINTEQGRKKDPPPFKIEDL